MQKSGDRLPLDLSDSRTSNALRSVCDYCYQPSVLAKFPVERPRGADLSSDLTYVFFKWHKTKRFNVIWSYAHIYGE
jgi:hypothetical protein